MWALGLLGAGLWKKSQTIRWQALVLLGVVIVKVFLFDLSFLEKFYRIVSFLLLGLALMLISFYYQRQLTGRKGAGTIVSARWNGRRRQIATMAALIVMAFATLAATPLPTAWEHWRYSRAIELTPTDAARLVSVVAPLEIYPRTQAWLGDLRVIDDAGTEVPYVDFKREGTTKSVSLPTTLRENSFTAGEFTQLVLDAGARAPFHNAVRILTRRV